MTYDLEAIKRIHKMMEAASRSELVDFWFPQEGENRIRFLPVNYETPFKVVGDHYIGNKYYRCPFILKNENCPICDLKNELAKSSNPESVALANTLIPSLKGIWVIALREDIMSPKFWSVSPSIHKKLVNWFINGTYGDFLDPIEGRDFILTKTVKFISENRKQTSYDIAALDKSHLIDDKNRLADILNKIPSFDSIPTKRYEDLEKIVEPLMNKDIKDTEPEKAEKRAPKCFGKEYDKEDVECQSCSFGEECKETISAPHTEESKVKKEIDEEEDEDEEEDDIEKELAETMRRVREARKTER